MTQHVKYDHTVTPVYVSLKFFQSRSWEFSTILHTFYWSDGVRFLNMTQKQSQSLIFATQPLRPTLFMFDDLKQMLQQVLTAKVTV